MKYYTITLNADEVKEILLMVEVTLDKVSGMTVEQFMDDNPLVQALRIGTEIAKDIGRFETHEKGKEILEKMERLISNRLSTCEGLRNKLKSLDYV